MNKNFKSRSWFFVGLLSAATFGAFANFPSTGSTAGSMAPTEDVSEIRAHHHADLSFDEDLARLSSVQGRYRENLPLLKARTSRTKTSAKPIRAPFTVKKRAKVGQN
jgi:hypothetical protein